MILKAKRSKRVAPNIDFMPLIDCAFILIIFFAASTTMITSQTGMKMNLPEAVTAEKMPVHVQIAIDENLSIFIGDLEVSETTLAQMVRNHIVTDGETSFIVGAAQSVPYERLIRVLDVVRKAGGTRLALQTKQGYETEEETN